MLSAPWYQCIELVIVTPTLVVSAFLIVTAKPTPKSEDFPATNLLGGRLTPVIDSDET